MGSLAKDAQETAEDASILKRFKILHLVGTGNYARVYKGLSQSGRELAIKSINLSKTSENYKTKFLPRELTILRKVSHENICKIHEILQVADRIFIVMQFCTRGTIADLLQKDGPQNEPVTRHLLSQILDAVSYLHSLDLAHRDLKRKPRFLSKSCSTTKEIANRLVAANARNRDYRSFSIRLNDTFCGTLPYLSPEMIKQQPYDGRKTDIWSLGVCLYVMLNDRLPFPFEDVKIMVTKQVTRDYRFRATMEFSEQVKDLVTQMLEPEFIRRPTCADIMRHSWFLGHKEKPQVS